MRKNLIVPGLVAAACFLLGAPSVSHAADDFETELIANCEKDGKELIIESDGFACCQDIKGTDGKDYKRCTVCKDNGDCRARIRKAIFRTPADVKFGTTKAPKLEATPTGPALGTLKLQTHRAVRR